VFIIGAFDTRITFYSQQVRALSLAHALQDQGILHDGLRIAVVGAGAAGVTAAAALTLLANVTVDLYERAEEVLPLQRATLRRRLDPHIYNWPEVGSDDPIAALPLLDWEAGPARTVRDDVKAEFDAIVQATNPRLRVNVRHRVVATRLVGTSVQLDWRRDARAGEAPDPLDGQMPGQATFDLVLLAFGFGLEPEQAAPGVPSMSYWDEGGIPVAEFQGRPTPRFLISGNGDGGLIDLVAASSADFDHAGTIREIVRQPNIEQVMAALAAIDQQALTAFRGGHGYNFLAAYDAQLRADLQGLGLFDLVAARLRPGVRITLQTLTPEAFSIETATLNRVAAYLVIRSLEAGAQTDFVHIHDANLTPIDAPAGALYQAAHWFNSGGQTFGVDRAIVRRGPQRDIARAPFAGIMTGYGVAHADWRALHGAHALVPKLSQTAHETFVNVARNNHLPPPMHVQRQLQQHLPTILRAQADAAGVRWSGALAPEGVGEVWDTDGNTAEVLVPGPPAGLAEVAPAIVRLVLHANRASLVGNPGDWKVFSDPLTSASAHAKHLASLAIRPGPAGGTQNPRSGTAAEIAGALNLAMDRWVLEAVHVTLQIYTVSGRDPGHAIGFAAAADLRLRMGEIWDVWRGQFLADSGLLDRFLRLTICAEDDDARQDEARVLVGPHKLPHITRAIAAALAIAAAWPNTTPKGQRPGNLSRATAAGAPWHGHTCAADLISREPTAIAATNYMWRTHFVVLSQLDTPLSVVTLAQSGFAEVDEQQPSLSQPGGGGLFLTLDASFRAAAAASLAALTALLGEVETQHFTRLSAAVVQG
jgi:hypothetical protein